MTIREARAIAEQWVLEKGCKTTGFCGAFFHGSVNVLPDEAVLSPTSDVDVMLVLTGAVPENKLGKFIYQGVLLEVSYISQEDISSAEVVLGNYHLANSFRHLGIIADSDGQLAELQAIVMREFPKASRVRQRCDAAANNVLRMLRALDDPAPFHDHVMAWLFANGVLTHVLLVAGLRNPTVRTRYVAAKGILTEYGYSSFYETLLECLGCAEVSREQVERHLHALAEAFDTTNSVLKTPYRFAADLMPEARSIAIDGNRELIERGLHREAIFWMVATYSRCMSVLSVDASKDMQEQHRGGYLRLLEDLRIGSVADVQQRGELVKTLLPRVREVAEAILMLNPEVVPD